MVGVAVMKTITIISHSRVNVFPPVLLLKWHSHRYVPLSIQNVQSAVFIWDALCNNFFPQANNPPNLLNNMNSASAGANNSLINNMSPAIVQKMLAQGGASQGFAGASGAGARALQPQSQPSTQQLRMLVQQIQMAVQAGYLNHQVRKF